MASDGWSITVSVGIFVVVFSYPAIEQSAVVPRWVFF